MLPVPPQGGRKYPNQEMLQIDTTNISLFVVGAFDVGRNTAYLSCTAKKIWFWQMHAKEERNIMAILKDVVPKIIKIWFIDPELDVCL